MLVCPSIYAVGGFPPKGWVYTCTCTCSCQRYSLTKLSCKIILQVQAATEALIEKIQRPTQLQTPSIDFSKPRLVQITVTDVGACMPLQPVVRQRLRAGHHSIALEHASATCIYMYTILVV